MSPRVVFKGSVVVVVNVGVKVVFALYSSCVSLLCRNDTRSWLSATALLGGRRTGKMVIFAVFRMSASLARASTKRYPEQHFLVSCLELADF